MKRDALGSELVFYDPLNVMSYAMARMKTEIWSYKNNDPRFIFPLVTEDDLRDELAEGPEHKLVVKGGAWWRHTEICKARARGDQETAARLQAEADTELAAILSNVKQLSTEVGK